jgi:hypothetical protein
MTVQMDDTFAAGLRAALVEHVQASATGRRRRWRVTPTAGVAVLVTGGGVAAPRRPVCCHCPAATSRPRWPRR